MRRLLLGTLLFVLAAFGVGEAVIRLGRVQPRVVIVRPGPSIALAELHGRVVWEQRERREPDEPSRQHPDCPAGAHVLQVYGDSILFGSGLRAAESPGPQLEHALAGRPAPWCVQTFAQPGATLHPQLGFALDHVPAARPDVVLVELWVGSPRVPVKLGDAAYYLDELATDPAGYPVFAGGIGGAWHHALFDASRFWAWLTFAVNPGCVGCGQGWQAMVDGDLDLLRRTVEADGGRLVLVLAPPLDRPFVDQLRDPVPWYDPAIAWADAHGVPWVRLERLLAGHDLDEVRMDPCCHYSAAGSALVGGALAAWLDPVLDAAEAR